MWLRIDDQACRSFNSGGLAYFRFRLKLWFLALNLQFVYIGFITSC
jgi:hypothetical protein